MTNEQLILLRQLKESRERGAASLSCGQRRKVAEECVDKGWAEKYGWGYRITLNGLKAHEKGRKDK